MVAKFSNLHRPFSDSKLAVHPRLLVQVCIREARLSVTPAIFTEPKPEPRMVRGKMAPLLQI